MDDKIRVLIVDDNVEFCDLLQEVINGEEDMEVVGIAYDGREAVRIISEESPDVVLLDVIMPKLDGIGVLYELYLNEMVMPHVIVLTALNTYNLMESFKAYGADSYLIKPFSLYDLIYKIRDVSNNESLNTEQYDKLIKQLMSGENGIENAIEEVLYQLGIPPNRRGYIYLKESLLLAFNEPERLIAVTTLIFPQVAEKFSTTSSGVQAGIRNTIRMVWESTDRRRLKEILGSTLVDRCSEVPPSNGEFIANIVELLQKLYISCKEM